MADWLSLWFLRKLVAKVELEEQYPKYEALSRIRKSVHNLPEVKKYYESGNAVKEPFCPDYAKLKF